MFLMLQYASSYVVYSFINYSCYGYFDTLFFYFYAIAK